MRALLGGIVLFLSLVSLEVTFPAYSQTPKAPSPPPLLPAETKAFLTNADEFTLFSLDPNPDFEHKLKNTFHDHRVVGATRIGADAERTRLVNALEQGIANGRGAAQCFNPRHGIRAKKDGKAIECLICFECGTVLIFSESATSGFCTASTPQAIFNASLAIHKVRVAAE